MKRILRPELLSTTTRFGHFENLELRRMLATYAVDFDRLLPSDYTDSEILVRFNDGVSIEELKKTSDYSTVFGDGFRADSQLFEINVQPGQSVKELVEFYSALDIVDYAEPNYLMELMATPNDEFYSVQWGFPNIDAETAWDTRTDSSSIVVGVIDSGVQYDHPDLVDNIWTNPGEIAGNGIDDDGNGYVDDFYGYDFDNDDNDPMDDNGHGTHVAGTIGAKGNNTIGLTGVGWNASLMSLKVIGGGSNADVARAIDYATDNGAKITNNSYGYAGNSVGGSNVLSGAIGRAKNAGVLYVVAAGNSRTGIPASDMDGSFNSWPAEYSKVHDNVITVGAIDEGDVWASYSHWGDQSVQIAAPGTQIGSTYTNSGYVYSSGTSMAAPHVAGAAALLWAERPDLSYLDIKAAILDTARPEHLDRVGEGLLDLGAAMASIVESSDTIDIGYSGIATGVNHVWQQVDLPMSFSDPVVVAGGSTRAGGHQGVVRVRNVTSDSFDIRFEEWDYLDGGHAQESIGFLVVESGTHSLEDGTQLVAGTTELTNEAFRTIVFDSAFSATPLVLAQVTTSNDNAAVAERIRNITSDSFQIQMQEEEVADGTHATESVGYIAIDIGTASSGDTSLNALRTDDSVTHRNTTVDFGSIGGASIPVILSDMQTRDGGDVATLRHRAETSTSVTIFVEEEKSRDTEIGHTTEIAGVLAIEAGVLVGNSVDASIHLANVALVEDFRSDGGLLKENAFDRFNTEEVTAAFAFMTNLASAEFEAYRSIDDVDSSREWQFVSFIAGAESRYSADDERLEVADVVFGEPDFILIF